MIREFSYTSSKGTSLRKVFVIRETSTHVEGIDLSLLSDEDSKVISEKYKDFVPVSDKSVKVELEDFNPSWNKAYRQFVKSKINHAN